MTSLAVHLKQREAQPLLSTQLEWLYISVLSRPTVCPSECASSTSRWQLHRPAPASPPTSFTFDTVTLVQKPVYSKKVLFLTVEVPADIVSKKKGSWRRKETERKQQENRNRLEKVASLPLHPAVQCTTLPSTNTGTRLTTRLVWDLKKEKYSLSSTVCVYYLLNLTNCFLIKMVFI